MSFRTTRAEIAAQLSTVTGVQGYEKRPNVITPGDAWALLNSADRGPGLAFGATWRIIVILGGDEVTAIDQTDVLLPELAEALDPVAYVDTVIPVAFATSGGDLYALEITARSD